jgi:hypothetical protein
MVSDLDIWRAANLLLIRQHGNDAALEAARLQDPMLERGDDEGRHRWQRIRRVIEALRAPLVHAPIEGASRVGDARSLGSSSRFRVQSRAGAGTA